MSSYDGQIHLLLTDIVMPGMNGRDLSGRIIAHYPELKVLYMSGYSESVIAHRGVLEAGVHFIQKPFSLRDLTSGVRKALDEAAGVRKN
jgi:two-component system sensor histidine kinase EvgS